MALLVLVALIELPSAAAVTTPTQPKKTFTKATVKWPKLSASSPYAFAVACGKTTNLCATVKPVRQASKFSWIDPAGVLAINATTDPGCNEGKGGFLTVGTPATGCTPGQHSIAAKLNGKVVSTAQGTFFDFVGTLTPDDNFEGRNQDKYGIAETITLAVTINPSNLSAADIGGLQWGFSGVGALPLAGTDGTGSYAAGAIGGDVTLELSGIDGPSAGISKAYPKKVIAPTGEYMVQASGTGIRHVQNTASVGFKGSSFVLPKDVSFYHIQRREGTVAGTGIGFYAPLDGQVHPAGGWYTVSGCNITTGCSVDVVDTVYSGAYTGPYGTGGDFVWRIPREYTAASSPATQYFEAVHHQYVDALGTCCIEKAGAGPFCKQATDPSSDY